jgi:hypothetical protein
MRVNARAGGAPRLEKPLQRCCATDHGSDGATRAWRWVGYENSWMASTASAPQSVSGGATGGRLFISARDQRFGP